MTELGLAIRGNLNGRGLPIGTEQKAAGARQAGESKRIGNTRNIIVK